MFALRFGLIGNRMGRERARTHARTQPQIIVHHRHDHHTTITTRSAMPAQPARFVRFVPECDYISHTFARARAAAHMSYVQRCDLFAGRPPPPTPLLALSNRAHIIARMTVFMSGKVDDYIINLIFRFGASVRTFRGQRSTAARSLLAQPSIRLQIAKQNKGTYTQEAAPRPLMPVAQIPHDHVDHPPANRQRPPPGIV